MTITQKEGVQTLTVTATMHKMLTSIRAVDNKTVKWNISTIHDSWESVKQWLDKHLLPLYNSIHAGDRTEYKPYSAFPEPQRLKFKPPSSNRIVVAETSDYAQRIQTQMLGNSTCPMATHHKPPAWKSKRPKLVWTFNEEDFPPSHWRSTIFRYLSKANNSPTNVPNNILLGPSVMTANLSVVFVSETLVLFRGHI
jgi:hypothetical protein